MAEHECKHEVDLALMGKDIAHLKKDMEDGFKDVDVNLKDILRLLKGNGGEGLVTTVALNKKAINRAWWFIGAIALLIVGGAIYIIRGGVT